MAISQQTRRIIAAQPQGGVVQGPYPAPAGYQWAYVSDNSINTADNNNAVVELQRIAA